MKVCIRSCANLLEASQTPHAFSVQSYPNICYNGIKILMLEFEGCHQNMMASLMECFSKMRSKSLLSLSMCILIKIGFQQRLCRTREKNSGSFMASQHKPMLILILTMPNL